jgi:hypothetical protein
MGGFSHPPQGFPELIPPVAPSFSQKRKDSVLHPRVQKALRDRGKENAIPWLAQLMETGHVPVRDMQPQRPGDLGPSGDIGVGAECRVQYLQGNRTHPREGKHKTDVLFLGPLDHDPMKLELDVVPVPPPPATVTPKAKFGFKGPARCAFCKQLCEQASGRNERRQRRQQRKWPRTRHLLV